MLEQYALIYRTQDNRTLPVMIWNSTLWDTRIY